jgi:hypothetical protein
MGCHRLITTPWTETWMTPDEHARQAEQLTLAADRLHDTLGDPQLNAVARRDAVAEIHALAALAQVHAALSVRS